MLKGSFAICESTPTATKLGAFRALVLACLLFAAGIGPATAASDETVRNFIERVNQASTDLLSADEKAEERCRSLLGWAFDVPAMAQYALGKAWDRATSAEREDFLAAFEGAISCRLSSPHAGLSRRDDELCRSKASGWRRPQGCKPLEPARCRGNLDLEIAAFGPVLAHSRRGDRWEQRLEQRTSRICRDSRCQSWRYQRGDRLYPQARRPWTIE